KQAARKIVARDRRLAAVHEAGHVVVARRLGLEILSAWIRPDGSEERSWDGRVQINTSDAPKIARQMVGVAGSVAEWLWEGGEMEDSLPDFRCRKAICVLPVVLPVNFGMQPQKFGSSSFVVTRDGKNLSPKPVA